MALTLLLGISSLIMTASLSAQMAAGKSKFVGNIIAGSVPANYSTYWNQITPENAGKWGSVEGTRNSMNWGQLDTSYNQAQSKGYKFKQHCFVWGAQYPSWITGLTQAQQRAEIEEWITLFAARYPNTWAVDVVNEPIKTPCPFKNALGGDGATGWDWVITAFQIARQKMPNAKLFINEYGTENDVTARNQMKTIVNLLKARGLIDGIGIQAHCFNLDSMSAAQMKTCLDDYATTGVDIYISELDIRGAPVSDAGQKSKYQELFPVMWNHASVKGITLWGYVEGQTWIANTGLLNSNGTERSAMVWLKGFVSSSGGGGGTNTIWLEAERGTVGATWNDNVADTTASAGQYVTVKPGNNSTASAPTTAAGLVTLTFNVTTAGTYKLWFRTICPDANGDSFWVKMDSGSFAMWNGITAATAWRWDSFATTYTLSAGSHTLTIGYREDGAKLDKVYLTAAGDTPTGTGGTASN